MELTAAEPRRKGLVQLYLDGQPGPKIDEEVFVLSRLKAGAELTQEELEALLERSGQRPPVRRPKRRRITWRRSG